MVRSTFSHAAAPPKMSSTCFRVPWLTLEEKFTSMAQLYGQVRHTKIEPPGPVLLAAVVITICNKVPSKGQNHIFCDSFTRFAQLFSYYLQDEKIREMIYDTVSMQYKNVLKKSIYVSCTVFDCIFTFNMAHPDFNTYTLFSIDQINIAIQILVLSYVSNIRTVLLVKSPSIFAKAKG